MNFIVYLTTAGSKVDVEADTTRDAVKTVIELEAAAGRPDAKVIAVSWMDPELQHYFPVGNELLEGIPGTTLFTGVPHDLDGDD